MTTQQHESSNHSTRENAAPKVTGATKLTPDQETIEQEAGHFPDRDQEFRRADQGLPPNLDRLYDDSWETDPNERVNDDRSRGKDFVTALNDLDRTGHLNRPSTPLPSETDHMTAAHKAPYNDTMLEMDDKKLMKIADAISIPGRKEMTRHELLEAIRAAGPIH